MKILNLLELRKFSLAFMNYYLDIIFYFFVILQVEYDGEQNIDTHINEDKEKYWTHQI